MKEKQKIVLRTRDDVYSFLRSRNIPETDPDYMWECPLCNTKNYSAYFSHRIYCAGCGKYSRPTLRDLPAPFDVNKEKERIKTVRGLLAEYEDICGEINDLEDRKTEIDKKLDELGYDDII